ncbi:MAG: hypothetical protein H6618_07780 [Deltaproteobacteria bacterium]|nr:hypothetical protein [Deltaproteobacteria bacterium]
MIPRRILLILFFCTSFSYPASSGVLIAPSLSWSVFSVRPLEEADNSQNFYGISPGLTLGYSFWQFIDIAGYTVYTPGVAGTVQPGTEDASLIHYGAALALRINEKIYLGVRGGEGLYRLLRQRHTSSALPGIWRGPCGTAIIGAIHKVDKENYWQISFELTHMVADRIKLKADESATGMRRIDEFRLTVSYAFNHFLNHSIGSSLLRSMF